MENTNKIKSILFGVAVGDALGVPVEFQSREMLKKNPVREMTGYGTHNQPPGTFSDDSSLTFCLAEALTVEFDLNVIAGNFVRWYRNNFWTARGSVFDIGNATRQAIERLEQGISPELAGSTDPSSNGNGSLMRILPLMLFLLDKKVDERFRITQQVSSITHGHIRSVIACHYYLEFARHLFVGKEKNWIYKNLQQEIPGFLASIYVEPSEIELFNRLLKMDISDLKENEIRSSGYVLHTLEAAIWCLLTTSSYKDAVLKAVNLGEDTDTTAAVTGGMAGLLYGFDNIPTDWLNQLAGKNDIENLAERLAERYFDGFDETH